MDEVDIDNVEDLNELEARLYAQIHHEATEECNMEAGEELKQSGGDEALNTNCNDTGGTEQNYETSSNTNRLLSRRYWAGGAEHFPKQQLQQKQMESQQHQQNTKQRFIRNPFKTQNKQRNDPPSSSHNSQKQHQSKQSANQSDSAFTVSKINEVLQCSQGNSKPCPEKNITHVATKSTTAAPPSSSENIDQQTPSSNANKKNKNAKMDQQSTTQKMPPEKSNLKLNPVAEWMQRNKNPKNKKANQNNNNISNNNLTSKNLKNTISNMKQGPFSKQEQKLQKAKRIDEKKQKSKNAKNTAAALASKMKSSEVIDLDTENESDSSDVILIPVAPPPTYIVDDSGDDDNDKDKEPTMEHEENALDSTDVQMLSTSTSFIKPQSLSAVDGSEKRLENSSRCTSPCSIQSSDDFIGQTDRSRLLAGNSGMADDEDLLVLTNDMNSLLEMPETTEEIDDEISNNKEQTPLDSNIEQLQAATVNVETNDSLEFATPGTSKQPSHPKDYRVDQSQFRALDVYESESDITDSVYSKGTNKTTVIRQIDTSADEEKDIGSFSQRTKRLRKRRASSSNKESDPNNENLLSSSDNENHDEETEEDDDNKVLRTSISFIARGPAVEHCKSRKRSRTLSSPITQRRKSAKTSAVSTDHMSDTEFIETLNNLAQGQEGEQANQQKDPEFEEADESETENIPSARDIAEKILSQQNNKEKTKKTSAQEVAVPEDVLNELDKVFEAIDQLDKQDLQGSQRYTPDDTVKISDSSDSDREKHIRYKSSPNDDAQIIQYSSNKTPLRTHADNGSPIYNVIYSRGHRKPGGIGWNDEMRRFYNDSWNGEHFILHKVFQKMNPDKNLWKIYSEDRFNIKPNKRHSNMKCTNCCEFGHMRSKCKRPRKPIICYMCGDSGHHEPRCPNTICLRCGNKTQVFTKSCNACTYQNRLICPICKIRGHSLDYCPDKWRRYHSTTEPNTHPNSNINYNPRKFCCICGGRGHLSDNCRSAVRFMEYPAIVSTIKSHQKSYGDVAVKTLHNGIALNLMYDPCKDYNFDLTECTSIDKYYGRFLKAVNMEFLLKRKRHINEVTTEIADTTAKKTKRLSKKYVANPYSKVGTANQRNIDDAENAPNQVQEITESSNTDKQDNEQSLEEQVIALNSADIEDNSGSDNVVELVGSTIDDDDIQLNTINPKLIERHDENFKSPKKITSTSLTTTLKSQAEPPSILDSDSNYSFSEHFDVPSTSVEAKILPEASNISKQEENLMEIADSELKSREMETLPDFIPLIDSTEDRYEQNSDNLVVGISKRFVSVVTDNEGEEERRTLSPLSELPCEAKIYLNHVHSKYLLSPVGNTFLVKASRACKLKARLDFTSIGHVLVIFGLPSNQDKFQRELLMKYRELANENNQRQLQSNLNVPKRADVLIRFLRENITQLLNNLGNVNQLLKRLQFLERQQSKSGYKLAERVRRSLNMILIGQAGLQDGTMHLHKLLISLKTLMNEYNNEDVTPPQLRSEITDHWKVIFSPYRHENYQQLVNAYNKLISKNSVPKLVIDPILLGQKVLNTSLSDEQKQKLEQTRPGSTPTETKSAETGTETIKQIVPNPLNQKNTKAIKRKQNSVENTSSPTTPTAAANKNKTSTSRPASPVKGTQIAPTTSIATNKTSTSRSVSPAKGTQTANTTRADNSNTPSTIKTKSTPNSSSTAVKSNKTPAAPAKTKSSSATTPTTNKSKQSTSATKSAPAAATANATPKKPPQKMIPPPPFSNPETPSTVSTAIQEVSDKWKSTCDTLLTEISADKPKTKYDDKKRDSKLPSTFWSRESMRYLNDCVRLAAARPHILEKLQRVQNKSKSGQLSYNDYLAVIKLHTALNGK